MADEAEKKEEGQEAPKEGQAAEAGDAKGSSKMGLIVVVVVGFLVMTLTPLITFFAVKMSMPKAEESSAEGGGHGKEKTEEKKTAILNLNSIMVNIIETKCTRILRINPQLSLDLSGNPKLEEELKGMLPMLQDKVMLAAKKKTMDELDGPEGQEGLRREILAEINAAIRASKMQGTVVDVFFSEFMIQ